MARSKGEDTDCLSPPLTTELSPQERAVCRASDEHLFRRITYAVYMERDDDGGDEFVAVEVELPRTVLGDIDRLAVFHGYETPSAVVREALDSHS